MDRVTDSRKGGAKHAAISFVDDPFSLSQHISLGIAIANLPSKVTSATTGPRRAKNVYNISMTLRDSWHVLATQSITTSSDCVQLLIATISPDDD